MKKLWIVLGRINLAFVLLLAPVGIAIAFAIENFARYWVALMLPIISVVLLAFWYLVFGSVALALRAKRFGIFALVAVVAFACFKLFFRYDGSTSGASLPRFVPKGRTTEMTTETLASLPEEKAASSNVAFNAEPVEGVIDSPQFYGPGRDATWPDDQVIASFDWKANAPEELWRQPIGLGWSGFAVVGRRALTMEQRGNQEWVSCYDLLTGDLLWSHRDEARYYLSAATKTKEMAGDGPRAVPTVQGDRVFTYGATGVLNRLNLETGELVWQKDVIADLGRPLPEWGKSTSPLLIDDLGLVVVTGIENGGPTLLAFQAETGELAWQYEGNGTSYSSPRLISLHGERQIVSVNGHDVTGHDPATGVEKWRFKWRGHFPKVAQPVEAGENRILVTASYGAGSYLIGIDREGDDWKARSIWKSIRLKTKFSSAVIRNGFAYGLDEGRLVCVDLKDGSRVWKDGKYGFGQNLLVGDQLLIQAEDGYLAVASATPDGFVETARQEALNSMTWNPPTLAGRYLLVRNDKQVICFKLPSRKVD